MEEIFDIIPHLVDANNVMKGKLKIPRLLANKFTREYIELKKISFHKYEQQR